jgi:ABC-type uncharacterized transport system substrate-binding protein
MGTAKITKGSQRDDTPFSTLNITQLIISRAAAVMVEITHKNKLTRREIS